MIKRIVILGPPGVGKGTQAKRLAALYSWAHISTGDMLRKAIQDESSLGREVRKYVEHGDLVPDALMVRLVDQRVGEADCAKGFILDGFPRTVVQAEALDHVLKEKQLRLDGVLSIDVDDEEIVRRLSRRLLCEACGNMTQAGDDASGERRCASCGGKLIRRKDDEPDTVRHRLQVYRDRTESLIHYYRGKKMLWKVEGTGSEDDVTARIQSVFAAEPEHA